MVSKLIALLPHIYVKSINCGIGESGLVIDFITGAVVIRIIHPQTAVVLDQRCPNKLVKLAYLNVNPEQPSIAQEFRVGGC